MPDVGAASRVGESEVLSRERIYLQNGEIKGVSRFR